jgi:hypothetical protein
LEREVRRSQHLKELTEEINDDSDDLFNLIELERVKNAEEYEQQLRQEQNKSPSASSTSSSSENESDRPSNTTPEPSRTPTMFNVNASEFKVSRKTAARLDRCFFSRQAKVRKLRSLQVTRPSNNSTLLRKK